MRHILATGQTGCFDERGRMTECAGTGQDGEHRAGLAWPEPRFESAADGLVLDRLTNLTWTRNARLADFPLTWAEALDFVRDLNAEGHLGHRDWRLPNRRELRSLIHLSMRKPALPPDHPFEDVVQNWYWTSTTSRMSPGYAWYVHFEGGRMFYGKKDQYCLVWPVRGESAVLAATGQHACFDDLGSEIPCRDTGQDGELRAGAPWPEPRFVETGRGMRDELTELTWRKAADECGLCTWNQALACAQEAGGGWALPTINELESLVDASRADPALPEGHPFAGVQEAYWSATSSGFEPDWSYVLYLHKGAVGVGYKPNLDFYVWLVHRG